MLMPKNYLRIRLLKHFWFIVDIFEGSIVQKIVRKYRKISMKNSSIRLFLVGVWGFCFVQFSCKMADKCNRIRDGEFYFYSKDSTETLISRKDSLQVEITYTSKETDTSYWRLQWKNNCVFTLAFLKSTRRMPEAERKFYMSGNMVSEILSVHKKFYVFKATFSSYVATPIVDTVWFERRKQ